jgi:hypothetical protein
MPRITTDLHLGTFACDGWTTRVSYVILRRPPRHPHLLLGRLVGMERLEVLIFFPGARCSEQKKATLRARDFAHSRKPG